MKLLCQPDRVLKTPRTATFINNRPDGKSIAHYNEDEEF